MPPIPISRRVFLGASALALGAARAYAAESPAPLIGYTEYRANLPARHANQVTSRACIVRADGTVRRELAPELAAEENTWTQFAGWSPDGALALLGQGWEDPENATWEEEHKTFRMTEGWRFDMYTLDLATSALVNLTAVERVSEYNTGIVFLPGSDKLAFTALINGVSHPFQMDRDGRNKKDMTDGDAAFTYGLSASPDGRYVAYHKDYQVYVADAGGGDARKIETGNPFNFVPQWSPDGQWLMFVSGEHYNCHPCIVRPDGSDFRKLADRGGYSGVTTVYDVYDFHGGSSDVPVWAPDGKGVYYTRRFGEAIELMHVTLGGEVTRLTESAPGFTHYHPKPSPDGKMLAFGSTQTGTRQLYVMPAPGGEATQITQVPQGHGAMWAHWRPPIA
ncbi:MAG: PD40 domain-containing protein [Candidatus Hydrogenedentes bacterium]|nr:PD40 domain-containing protein [Candidatus Hydrogenedentota bacterium]